MSTGLDRLTAALADRYRIERELGQGGMATVYLAQDLKHEREVAIKVLRPELAAVIGAERFLKEIKTTANLQHPHILGLIDSGNSDSFLWYAMPFVDGESLRDRLEREKQLPIADAVRIATEVAGALDYAHRHGVIHRDIKPENILLHDGSALVADFGIALAASTAGTRMTETGMSLGTPHYMSPEQAMGEREITARSDVYALGCIAYEMLVGEPPFTGPTAQAIIARVMTEEPRSLSMQRKTVPPHVEAAVVQALQKLPADRFATAAEFSAALANSTGHFTTHGARLATRAPIDSRQVRLWQIVAGASLLVALGVTLLGMRRGSSSEELQLARQLTFEGNVIGAALSPDGAWLAYVRNDCLGREFACGNSLLVREVDGTASVPIAPGWNTVTSAIKWSADGAMLAFVGNKDPGQIAVHLTDRLGSVKGSIPVQAHALAFATDGKSISVVLGVTNNEFLARYDLKSFARIDSVPLAVGMNFLDINYNHAGNRLAAIVETGGKRLLLLVSSRGELLDSVSGLHRPSIRWTHDDAAVFGFQTAPGTADDLVRTPVHGAHFAPAERATLLGQIPTGYSGVFDGSQTGRVAVLATPMTHQIQIIRLDDTKRGWQSWTQRTGFLEPASISPNDSLLASTATDNLGDNVYVFTLATGASRPLTTTRGGYEFAKWSPDGIHVAMARYAGTTHGVVLVNVSGGAERMLVPGATYNTFAWIGPNAIAMSSMPWLVTLDTLGTHVDSMTVPDSLAPNPNEELTSNLATRHVAWWSARADGVVIADLATKTLKIMTRHAGVIVPLALFADGSIIAMTTGDSSAKSADRRRNAVQRVGADGISMTHLVDVPLYCNGLEVSASGKWAVCSIRATRPDVWLADKAGKSGW